MHIYASSWTEGPQLTKKTVRGPTAADCGGFQWVVQWVLARATTLAIFPGTMHTSDTAWSPCGDQQVGSGQAGMGVLALARAARTSGAGERLPPARQESR